jgi:hypothetical protein
VAHLRRNDPARCPTCRERVTPFAAGCALCGTTLDPRRYQQGPTRAQLIGSRVAAFNTGGRHGNLFPDWRSNPAAFFVCLLIGLCSCAIVGTLLGGLVWAVGRLV